MYVNTGENYEAEFRRKSNLCVFAKLPRATKYISSRGLRANECLWHCRLGDTTRQLDVLFVFYFHLARFYIHSSSAVTHFIISLPLYLQVCGLDKKRNLTTLFFVTGRPLGKSIRIIFQFGYIGYKCATGVDPVQISGMSEIYCVITL